jgi:hypothetical protein
VGKPLGLVSFGIDSDPLKHLPLRCFATEIRRSGTGGPLREASGCKQMPPWVLPWVLPWKLSLGKVALGGAIFRKVFPYYGTNSGTSIVYAGAYAGKSAYVG